VRPPRPATLALTVVLTLAAGLLPATASAAPAVNGVFDLSGSPGHLTEGPDGNIWATLSGSGLGNELARITPQGTVTEFDPADVASPVGIATGDDGNLWVTQPGGVAKVPPAIFFGKALGAGFTRIFGGGAGSYMASFGTIFGICMIIILALTVINLVFRFMKIATSELLGEAVPVAKNGHIATIVALILTFILVKTGSWRYIWVLFGGANQLMAGLALLLITLWLVREKRGAAMSGLPFLFMYITTICALAFSAYGLITKVIIAPGKLAAAKALAGNAAELTGGWFAPFSSNVAQAAKAASGGIIFGSLFAAALAVVLILAALVLGYDGLKAYQKYRAAKAQAATAEAPA